MFHFIIMAFAIAIGLLCNYVSCILTYLKDSFKSSSLFLLKDTIFCN